MYIMCYDSKTRNTVMDKQSCKTYKNNNSEGV